MDYIEVVRQNYHLQGFSCGNGFMYWSFTDSLVKTTLSGTMKCQVEIPDGHLGDCKYHDGKVYASYLGNALPGHAWNDWTSFQLYVFDANDLHVMDRISLDICDRYQKSPESSGGFQGIDGVTVAPDPITGETKLFVACALHTDERYASQILLQLDLQGNYEKEYHIFTGNTAYGIQNLDYDWEKDEFWFSTYGPSEAYQPKEMLYCVSGDLSRIRRKYQFSTPYGFECLGNGEFYASVQFGKNGDRGGIAYRCRESVFEQPKNEQEATESVLREGTRRFLEN